MMICSNLKIIKKSQLHPASLSRSRGITSHIIIKFQLMIDRTLRLSALFLDFSRLSQGSAVRQLSLTDNDIDDEGAEALARHLGPLLSALSIRTDVGGAYQDGQSSPPQRRSEGEGRLGHALRDLDVRRNRICYPGLAVLAAAASPGFTVRVSPQSTDEEEGNEADSDSRAGGGDNEGGWGGGSGNKRGRGVDGDLSRHACAMRKESSSSIRSAAFLSIFSLFKRSSGDMGSAAPSAHASPAITTAELDKVSFEAADAILPAFDTSSYSSSSSTSASSSAPMMQRGEFLFSAAAALLAVLLVSLLCAPTTASPSSSSSSTPLSGWQGDGIDEYERGYSSGSDGASGGGGSWFLFSGNPFGSGGEGNPGSPLVPVPAPLSKRQLASPDRARRDELYGGEHHLSPQKVKPRSSPRLQQKPVYSVASATGDSSSSSSSSSSSGSLIAAASSPRHRQLVLPDDSSNNTKEHGSGGKQGRKQPQPRKLQRDTPTAVVPPLPRVQAQQAQSRIEDVSSSSTSSASSYFARWSPLGKSPQSLPFSSNGFDSGAAGRRNAMVAPTAVQSSQQQRSQRSGGGWSGGGVANVLTSSKSSRAARRLKLFSETAAALRRQEEEDNDKDDEDNEREGLAAVHGDIDEDAKEDDEKKDDEARGVKEEEAADLSSLSEGEVQAWLGADSRLARLGPALGGVDGAALATASLGDIVELGIPTIHARTLLRVIEETFSSNMDEDEADGASGEGSSNRKEVAPNAKAKPVNSSSVGAAAAAAAAAAARLEVGRLL
jgi:hypothetical protein